MILITGSTGHFGKAAIDFLLKKGISANKISALVRDETKASDLKAKGITLKIGDYSNYVSLVDAFQGVDKLLFVSGSEIEIREKQQDNVVKAAKETGVKHIFYTSFERKNETQTSPIAFVGKSHLDTECSIKASGMTYTIFRNNLYTDLLPLFFGENVLETGIYLPAGDARVGFASRIEMAEAAANVLTSGGHENREYLISNTENVSFLEIAKNLSQLTGKSITYTSPDSETYMDTLAKAGIPKEYAGMFSAFSEAMKQGEFASAKTDLENLLGRKPISVKEQLKEIYTPKN